MIEHWVSSYGYWAVLVGAMLEGETVLIVGAYFAHRGYLSLPLVMLCAFVGSLLGDQIAFFFGRYAGHEWIERRPRLRARTERVARLLEKRRAAVLLGFRFVYGVRSVTPLLVGASGIKPAVFARYNVVGAALWALVVGALGYVFGQSLELVFAEAKRFEGWVIAFASGVLLLVWLRRWLERRRG
ncbi:MAG: DedA family protein [Myxococcales bacterium]|nr:DedA family protein [Myxococcales bacterium]